MTTANDISNRIMEAVMAQKLAPGSRLGEQQLAMLFDCSRTIVREALTRLSTRGIVTVSARRGWYVVEPSEHEAREAFEARRVIELGLLHQLKAKALDKAALRQLKLHLQREKAALAGTDVGLRTYLLGDFHVCLAECLGNALLADTLRDFTARTTLIAMLYQSSHDAAQSCEDHVRIVEALEAGDIARAELLMAEHIGTVQAALRLQASTDPLAGLRDALAPVAPVASAASAASAPSAPDTPDMPAATAAPAKRRSRTRSPSRSTPSPSDDGSVYLGALL
ncbi:GntR family transcriptional regulator [Acidovorax temperans]|uniref:GntR family transcriptional regulator n=1 Tax=Acidovorax temperans TaxID=80878 RepID=UPI002899BABA|nr:GntR family transcriptional regulator [Acidovorax temperans]